ncbi:hypothetical protein RchiOBHm_Chr7g0207431 [Rosa chinensis]|uniref:Uncharacterized protein n=1 Tax=Rosa chinensis TaxID=74649 RepID=A0A2P6P9H3_ROSCH|nr:hypothetical protein RchiOBHm_Chr7g0207431 [Rosa chinensis]
MTQHHLYHAVGIQHSFVQSFCASLLSEFCDIKKKHDVVLGAGPSSLAQFSPLPQVYS